MSYGAPDDLFFLEAWDLDLGLGGEWGQDVIGWGLRSGAGVVVSGDEASLVSGTGCGLVFVFLLPKQDLKTVERPMLLCCVCAGE